MRWDADIAMPRAARVLTVGGALIALAAVAAEPLLKPFAGTGSVPAAPWVVVGLPRQSKPFTRFAVVELDGQRALRVEADSSYGNLVHPLHLDVASGHLAWQWRVEEPITRANLRERQGDDIAMKVCVMWDMPIDRVPFLERQVLRLARGKSDVPLPAATVCYVWDATLPPGTQLDSPFTRRLRYLVLRSGQDPLHRWTGERRDIVADFLSMFGDETKTLPPIVGIAIGADADNTRTHSLAHAAALSLEP
jgi:hypothetical protein